MKKKKIIIIVIIIIISICLLIYLRYKPVAVLGYHGFTTEKDPQDNLIINIDKFEEQLKYLKDHNYHTLTLNELYEYKQGKRILPLKSILITIDDGYQSNYDLAFPLLKKYDMNAVVFYIGENINKENSPYMTKDTIKKIKKEYKNIEIASHSYSLHNEGSINQDKKKLKEDFKKMNKIIPSKFYAYPYGAYNENIIDVLKEEDYKLAFTFGPSKNHRKMYYFDNNYKIPRLNISNDMPLWKFKLRLKLPF